jgi:hypothetical protein
MKTVGVYIIFVLINVAAGVGYATLIQDHGIGRADGEMIIKLCLVITVAVDVGVGFLVARAEKTC